MTSFFILGDSPSRITNSNQNVPSGPLEYIAVYTGSNNAVFENKFNKKNCNWLIHVNLPIVLIGDESDHSHAN